MVVGFCAAMTRGSTPASQATIVFFIPNLFKMPGSASKESRYFITTLLIPTYKFAFDFIENVVYQKLSSR
jgi:hypothetical protein